MRMNQHSRPSVEAWTSTTLTRNTRYGPATGTKKGTERSELPRPDLTDTRARLRRILHSAFSTVERQHFSELDESYYEALRTALLDAGATDREIDGVAAAGLVTFVVEATLDTETMHTRREQFELICQHVACTSLAITIGHGDVHQGRFSDRAVTHV